MKRAITRRGFAVSILGALGAASCVGGIAKGGPPDAEVAAEEYRLGAGDQLRVTVYGETDLTGQYVVNSQGQVAFPLVGEISAQGKTLPEFGAALGAALQAGYVRQPNVSVEVMNYRPFFILGEVRTPGTYPFSASLTVQNAVATAQGFTYRADTDHVYIKHAGEDRERAYRLTSTTPVRPGDTVRIGERLF